MANSSAKKSATRIITVLASKLAAPPLSPVPFTAALAAGACASESGRPIWPQQLDRAHACTGKQHDEAADAARSKRFWRTGARDCTCIGPSPSIPQVVEAIGTWRPFGCFGGKS
jgi:hypothetical protein